MTFIKAVIRRLLNNKFLSKFINSKFINKETISYLIFGVLTTIISNVAFYLARYIGLEVFSANLLSNVLAITFAFFTNKIFVFESTSWKPLFVLVEIAKFFSTRFIAVFLETFLLMLLINVLGFNDTLMKMFTSMLLIITNYVLSKWFIFRKRTQDV